MAKNSSIKGAKKGRRFNRPRSEFAKTLCAQRKAERRKANEQAHARDDERGHSAWDEAKAARRAKRHRGER